MRSTPSAPRRHFFFVSSLSLLFTYLFFIEYLPPIRRVHIPYDLSGFHYPLNDYAFQSLRGGRLPEWDPTIYCGMSFAANVQAASFYPSVWLLYAANYHRSRLSYLSLEIIIFLHVWLAFVLCYAWLRHKALAPMAGILGACIFAYSGYMLLQLQHLGLVCAYAWLPLGLWSIDESIHKRTWRPLWKLVLASALAFLSGYPPLWVVLAVSMLVYAGFRYPLSWRPFAGVLLALVASLLVCMVQVLPLWEATAGKEVQERFGAGIQDLRFYLAYLVPNYFNFGLHAPIDTNPGYEYLYLGAAAFFGLFWVLRRSDWRESIPLLAILAVSLAAVANPFGLVWAAIRHSSSLADLVRGAYFLAGVTAAAAALAALGFDRFLSKKKPPSPIWCAAVVVLAALFWSFMQICMWLPDGRGVPVGWRSALWTFATLAVFSAAMLVYRSQPGRWTYPVAAALILAAGVDYKVFGTSLRVNAYPGDLDRLNRSHGLFPGMDDRNYAELRQHRVYRVVSDHKFGLPNEFRHYGLTTPQGFDPLMSRQYRTLVGGDPGDPTVDIDAHARKDLLKLLGVRYVVISNQSPRYSPLTADPDFRLLPAGEAFWRAFEFRNAQLPYRWEDDSPGFTIQRLEWKPERREFAVSSRAGGRFVFVEQFHPGWQAWIDDRPVSITKWGGAFQSISVPAGSHRIVFRFRSQTLRWGAAISALTIAALVLLFRLTRDSSDGNVFLISSFGDGP